MKHATRHDVVLVPALDDSNFGKLWYIMLGCRCLGIVYHNSMPSDIQTIIDDGLSMVNAATDAYMATI